MNTKQIKQLALTTILAGTAACAPIEPRAPVVKTPETQLKDRFRITLGNGYSSPHLYDVYDTNGDGKINCVVAFGWRSSDSDPKFAQAVFADSVERCRRYFANTVVNVPVQPLDSSVTNAMNVMLAAQGRADFKVDSLVYAQAQARQK